MKAGDRVKRVIKGGEQTGTVILGQLRYRPLEFRPDVPDEALCRVRWEGKTFSVIEDARELTSE